MQLTENAMKVLQERYLLKDEEGSVIETPDGLFRRVASTVASAEGLYKGDPLFWEERFYRLMSTLAFLPELTHP